MYVMTPAARPSDAANVPETLRELQGELTPAQMALLSHGHPGEQTAYRLAGPTACTDGMADIFPCSNVDLVAHMQLADIGGGAGNDMWGWVDPQTAVEYALVGRSNGTAFVDLSDPENPVYVGNLPTHTGTSSWRDIKVFEDHAFIVSDSNGAHGMQVFDLGQLRDAVDLPVEFGESAHYDGFGSAHNLAINEESGYAYAVGSTTCSGGLHMVDISNPLAPSFAGCFSADGYTHDVQCVDYTGPDNDHQGKEICFAANEDTLTIIDVTAKATPVQLSRTGYTGHGYTHQGWLTGDQTYYIHDDELDELFNGHNTRTYVWDVSDLDAPALNGFHQHSGPAIDHNQYVHGSHTFQANYQQGLRIMRVDDPASASLSEVGFFDTYPEADGAEFNGAWSNYPFFASGIVLVSDINRGLFILRPTQLATCHGLTLGHSGSGSDPWASPASSAGCPAGRYTAGAAIQLTASPAVGWTIAGWSGTDDDGSTATTNTVTMPASGRVVTVAYAEATCGAAAENLVLQGVSVTELEIHEACTSIVAGPSFEILGPQGQALFKAPLAVLTNGVSVGAGGSLTISSELP